MVALIDELARSLRLPIFDAEEDRRIPFSGKEIKSTVRP